VTERLPYVQQNRTVAAGQGHDAQEWRWLNAGAASAGVCGATDLKVSPSSGMQVSVARGGAFVSDGSAPTAGLYHVYNDGTVTLTIAASSPTQARIDIVVAEVLDTAAGSASDAFRIRAISGTPGASPTPPAVPARCLALAQISIAAAAGSVSSGNITDRRVAGGAWSEARGTVFSVAIPTWASGGTAVVATPTNVTIPTVAGRCYQLGLQGIVQAGPASTTVQVSGFWAGAVAVWFAYMTVAANGFHGFAGRSRSMTATSSTTAVKAQLLMSPNGNCDYGGLTHFEVVDVGGTVT
jgi:hypothetical protein